MVINEVARINLKEDTNGLFPYAEWKLRIFSSDTNPAHLHIVKDDWDVSFKIENGEMLCINSKGTDLDIFNYMCAHIKNWLTAPCTYLPISNRETAILTWEQLHD